MDLVLWAAFLVWTFSLGCFLNRDMDIWWHLRAGRDIVATGEVPRVDRYTFSAQGAPWIDLHWLFQLAVYHLYERGGSRLLTLAAAACGTLAVAIGTVGLRIPHRWGLTLACWAPAVLLMSGRFYVRPEIVTLVLLSVTTAAARAFQDRPLLIWWLVPMQLLWVNTQGLFVLGYVVVGAFVGELLLRRFFGHTVRIGWPFWLGVAAFLCVALVNPYGWRGAVFPFVLFRKLGSEHAFYGQHIAELMSIPRFIERNGLRNPYLLLHLALIAVGSASFLLPLVRRRFSPALLVIWIGFVWIGLRATRNSGLFAFMAGAVIVSNLRLFFLDRAPGRIRGRLAGRLAGVVLCLVGTAVVLSGTWYRWAGEGRLVGLGEHPFWHAHAAARVAADPRLPPYVFAYHEGQAALVEFYMGQEKRVWCDPRLEVVPRQALEEYYEAVDLMRTGAPGWRGRLARLPSPLAILLDHEGAVEAEATLLAAPEWQCVHYGDVAGVYVRGRFPGFPPVNFPGRYFRLDQAVPPARWPPGELKRAEWYVRLGKALLARPAAPPDVTLAVLLTAYRCGQRYRQYDPLDLAGDRVLGMAALQLWLVLSGTDQPLKSPADAGLLLELVVARQHLGRVLQLRPTDFVGLAYQFHTLRLLGDRAAALEVAARLEQLEPRTAQEQALLPVFRKEAEKLRRARAVPDRAPANLSELEAVTRELVRAGDYGRALAVLERYAEVKELDVDRAVLPWELADLWGWLYFVRGQQGQARRVWLAHTPVAPAGELAVRLGYSWLAQGEPQAASDRFIEALQVARGWPAAVVGRVLCHVYRGELPEAVDALAVARADGGEYGYRLELLRRLVRAAQEASDGRRAGDGS